MTDNQFFDSLKYKILDHRSAVPDDMWERIIKKKDKDRRGFLFFFGWFNMLIVCISLSAYLLMYHHREQPKPENHVPAVSEQQISQAPDHLNKSEVVPKKSTMSESGQHGEAGNGHDHPYKSLIKMKKNDGDTKSFNYDKMGLKNTGKEIESPSSQKDSLAGGNKVSSVNKKGAAVALLTVKKPSPNKLTEDSSKNTIKKKTQKDTIIKKWYLDIYASPDYPIDNTPNSPSTFSGHTKLSYTLGIRLNRTFGKHFSGKIGIQYSHINLADSGIVNLTSFDLPVLAGYSFGSEKLRMTFTAGVIANLSTSSKSYAPNELFKSNTGFSLYGGFNFEKKVNQKISIYMEPYYRYRLSSMTVSTYDIYKFIDVVGLTFGARYYFLKRQRNK
ncbi:MAG TPA: hypothetical protein VGI38_04585 [Puia sp.]